MAAVASVARKPAEKAAGPPLVVGVLPLASARDGRPESGLAAWPRPAAAAAPIPRSCFE